MAGSAELKIKIKPDIDLAEVISKLKNLENTGFEFDIDTEKAKAEFAQFTEQLKKIKAEMSEGADLDVSPEAFLKLKKAMDDLLNGELPALEEGIDKILKENYGESASGIKKMAAELDKTTKETLELAEVQKKALRQMELTGQTGTAEYKKLKAGLEATEKELMKLKGTAEEAQKKMSFADRMAKFGLMTNGIKEAVSSATALSASFVGLDTATYKIRSLGDEAAKIAPDLKKMSLDMSNNMAISAVDIQTASYDALSAGIKATAGDMKNFMESASKLAVGGSETVGNTVNLLSSMINAYGESASKTMEYSDVLSMTANLGKTSVAEMANTMSNVIPTAAAMGFSIKAVGGSLALMTANGIPTAQATTKLNQLLIEIQKPGKDLEDIMKRGGVSVENLGKKIKSGDVVGAFKDLDDAFKKSGVSATQAFSSSEAGAAFNTLTKDFSSLKEMMDGVGNSAGATQRAYDEMSQSIENRSKVAKQQLDNFITSAIDGSGALGTFAVVGSQMAEQMMPTITALAGMKELFGGVAQAIMTKLFPGLMAQAGATSAATGAQTGLNLSMSANPIGAIILGIVALIGVLALFFTQTEEGRQIWEQLKQTFEEVWNSLQPVFDGLINIFKEYIGYLFQVGKLVYEWLIFPFQVLFKVIGIVWGWFSKLIGIGTSTNSTMKSVGGVLNSVAGAIKYVGEFIGKLTEKFKAVKNIMLAFVGEAPELLGVLFDYAKYYLNPAHWISGDEEAEAKLKKRFNDVLGKIAQTAKEAGEGAKKATTEAVKTAQEGEDKKAKAEEDGAKKSAKIANEKKKAADSAFKQADDIFGKESAILANKSAQYEQSLKNKAIAEKRNLTDDENKKIEEKKLEVLKQQYAEFVKIFKQKGLISTIKADGQVVYGKVKMSDDDKTKIQEKITGFMSSITDMTLKLIPNIDVNKIKDELRKAQQDLDKQNLEIDIEAGTVNKDDVIAFYKQLLQEVQDEREKLTKEYLSIEGAEDDPVAFQKRAEISKKLINLDKQDISLKKEKQSELKKLLDKELKDIEDYYSSLERMQEKNSRLAKKYAQIASETYISASQSALEMSKNKELDDIDRQMKSELSRFEAAKSAEEQQKAAIQEKYNKQKLDAEKKFQAQKLAIEAIAAGESAANTAIADIQKIEAEKEKYSAMLAEAKKYGDTKKQDEIQMKIDELTATTKDKGDVLINTMEMLGQGMNEALASGLAGDNEGAKNAMKKSLGMIAGYIKKLAVTYVLEIVLKSETFKALAAAAGPFAPLVTAGAVGLVTGGINAILNPLLNKVLSFPTGAGYINSPQLIQVGDGSRLGGENREILLRDDQFNATLDKVVIRNAEKTAEIIASAYKNTIPNQLVAKVAGRDLYLIMVREQEADNIRTH